jgi:hypothetical protein
MQRLLPTLALLTTAVSLLALPVQAQAPDTAPILTDDAGDVVASVNGQSLPAPGMGAIDLRELKVVEEPSTFTFAITVEDLADGARVDQGTVQAAFNLGPTRFFVNMWRAEDSDVYFGALGRVTSAGGMWEYIRPLEVERDIAAKTIWTTLDRTDLLNGTGQVPSRGDELTNIRSYGTARMSYVAPMYMVTGYNPVWVGDAMPAYAQEGGRYAVLYGGRDGEDATLSTSSQFRASNGEATTYQFMVSASHRGAEASRFVLSVEDVPAGWNVTLPGGLLEIPFGEAVEFPVYVQTPMRHQHGAAETFTLHMHDEQGASWATLDLGVDYLTIPQPAGHHDTVYFHASNFGSTAGVVNPAAGGTNGWFTMNTQEDPTDTLQPIAGIQSFNGASTRFTWSVCMDPALRLGLDFDLSREGTLTLPVSTTRPLDGAKVEGRLLLLGPGQDPFACSRSGYATREKTALADLSSSPQSLGANADGTLTAALVPTAAADYVPYTEGSNLVLEINVTVPAFAFGPGGPVINPGASLQLPLNEYHDAIQVEVPEAGAPAPEGFVAEEPEGKDAPGAAAGLLAAALAAAAFGLRRRDGGA